MEQGRRIVIIRHAEQVDSVFNIGDNWVKTAFNEKGVYTPYDLNMPPSLPERHGGSHLDWFNDPPITQTGRLQARLVGEALKAKCTPDHVYTSPSYRCIETAVHLLAGMSQMDIGLRVEAALFEWLGFYPNKVIPSFLDPFELKKHIPQLDTTGLPRPQIQERTWEQFLDHRRLQINESITDYYKRSHAFIKYLLENECSPVGEKDTIFLIGHAPTLDACISELIGQRLSKNKMMDRAMNNVAYLEMMHLVENSKSRQWTIEQPSSQAPMHFGNTSFYWQIYSMKSLPRL